jgi:hypothetical protein
MKNYFKTSNKLLIILFICIMFNMSAFAQDTLCIPYGKGVPGTELWNKAPNWWGAGAVWPHYDTDLYSPSWRGLLEIILPYVPTGTDGNHVNFRLLHHEEGGVRYLYMSWILEIVPDLSGENVLYIGLMDTTSSGKNVLIKIELSTISEAVATQDYIDSVWISDNINVTTWSRYPEDQFTSYQSPAWLDTTGKVWVFPDAIGVGGKWAFQMRVPLTNSDGSGDYYLDNGINLSDSLKIWFEAREGHPEDPFDPGLTYIPFSWPHLTTLPSGTPSPTTPTIDQWQDMQLVPYGAGCAHEGISILPENIGTKNTPDHQINLSEPNDFFAVPRNHYSDPISGIKARFRIANWGSHAIWEQDVAPDSLWADIADSSGIPEVGITLNAGSIALPSDVDTIFHTGWIPPAGEFQTECPVSDPADIEEDKRRCHQCMLVDLIRPGGVIFLNKSVYRNMNYVSASKFKHVAEINTKGLSKLPEGVEDRDIFLYVQAKNMPKFVKNQSDEIPNIRGLIQDRNNRINENRKKMRSFAAPVEDSDQPQPESAITSLSDSIAELERPLFKEMSEKMPTYTIHSYYDTGERDVNGSKIVKLMTSFGYFVQHEGELDGWLHQLYGAEKIGPTYYKISVPENGIAYISNTINAVDPKLYSASLHLGLCIPHGSIGNQYDPGLSALLDFSYRIGNRLYLESLVGMNQFAGKGSVDNLSIYQISVNAKYLYYRSQSGWFSYVNSGAGAYIMDPGDTKAGMNIGAGLQYNITHTFALEAAYNYHIIADTNPSFQFSSGHIVARIRF